MDALRKARADSRWSDSYNLTTAVLPSLGVRRYPTPPPLGITGSCQPLSSLVSSPSGECCVPQSRSCQSTLTTSGASLAPHLDPPGKCCVLSRSHLPTLAWAFSCDQVVGFRRIRSFYEPVRSTRCVTRSQTVYLPVLCLVAGREISKAMVSVSPRVDLMSLSYCESFVI